MRRARSRPRSLDRFRQHSTEDLERLFREALVRLREGKHTTQHPNAAASWREAELARKARQEESSYRFDLYCELTRRGVDAEAIHDQIEQELGKEGQ